MSQVSEWQTHGYTHWKRNFCGTDIRSLPPDPQIRALVEGAELPDLTGGSVLDLGCGSAKNLHWLVEHFGAARGVGTEIHPEIIAELAKAFPRFEFHLSDTVTLPYSDREFDFVIIRSVLVLIDRDQLLHAMGEGLRVAKRYYLYADYYPTHPYRTINQHNLSQEVFKTDLNPLIRATGIWMPIASSTISDDDEWNRFNATLYRRIATEQAYPARSENDLH